MNEVGTSLSAPTTQLIVQETATGKIVVGAEGSGSRNNEATAAEVGEAKPLLREI